MDKKYTIITTIAVILVLSITVPRLYMKDYRKILDDFPNQKLILLTNFSDTYNVELLARTNIAEFLRWKYKDDYVKVYFGNNLVAKSYWQLFKGNSGIYYHSEFNGYNLSFDGKVAKLSTKIDYYHDPMHTNKAGTLTKSIELYPELNKETIEFEPVDDSKYCLRWIVETDELDKSIDYRGINQFSTVQFNGLNIDWSDARSQVSWARQYKNGKIKVGYSCVEGYQKIDPIISTFNNTLTTESLDFIGNENQTRYISLPKYANYPYSYLNINGSSKNIYENSSYVNIGSSGVDFSFDFTGNNTDTWVLDNNDKFIYHFDSSFNNLSNGVNVTSLTNPYGVTWNGSDFWVNDIDADKIYHINSTANILDSCSWSLGNLLTNNNTDLWVLDYTNKKVYHIDISCSYINNFSISTSASGIDMDNSNNLYVFYLSKDYIEKINPNNYNILDRIKINGISGIGYGETVNDAGDEFRVKDGSYYIANVSKNGSIIYPENAWLELGTPDGTREWNHSGYHSGSNITSNFSSALDSYLDTCTENSTGWCDVPFVFHSDTIGSLEYYNLNISYNNLGPGKWWVTGSSNYTDFKQVSYYKMDELITIYKNDTGFDLSGAGMSDPYGMATNNSDFWIIDANDNFVYHFDSAGNNITDGFDHSAMGAGIARGMCGNDTDLWIGDPVDDFYYHVTLAGVNQTDGFDTTSFGSDNPASCTMNNTDMWIVDRTDDFVYHINKLGSTNYSNGFSLSAVGADSPNGIYLDSNNIFWVVDDSDDFVYRLDISGNNLSNGFSLADAGSDNPYSIDGNNTNIWVTDPTDDFLYHFTRVTTTIEDNKQQNNGTCTYPTCPSTTTGLFGNALDFDGLNDYINVPDSSSLNLSRNFTLSAWVNFPSNNSWSVAYPRILAKEMGGGAIRQTYNMVLSRASNSINCEKYNDGSSTGSVGWVTNMTPYFNSWTNIICIDNSTSYSMYINGNLVKSTTSTVDAGHTNTSLCIGNTCSGSSGFNGSIDDIRIYNYSLNSEQVFTLYSNYTNITSNPSFSSILNNSFTWLPTDNQTSNIGMITIYNVYGETINVSIALNQTNIVYNSTGDAAGESTVTIHLGNQSNSTYALNLTSTPQRIYTGLPSKGFKQLWFWLTLMGTSPGSDIIFDLEFSGE